MVERFSSSAFLSVAALSRAVLNVPLTEALHR